MVSQNALLFVNTMFGWPMVPSADMPGGGPAYPLPRSAARCAGGRSIVVRSWPVSLTVIRRPTTSGDSQQLQWVGTSFR